MFDPDRYIQSLIELLHTAYHERLLYVGLQGSYLRGEAGENSDIDIMVVVRDMTTDDLAAYQRAIATLENCEKSCGFICGEEELKRWNPLEVCHLLHTTKDYFGVLAELVPEYTHDHVHLFVKLSLGNLYHEICHRYVHASEEENENLLPYAYKSVFFILQNLHYLKSGQFVGTKNELLEVLSGKDRQVLETAISLSSGMMYEFDKAFSLLYSWCRKTIIET